MKIPLLQVLTKKEHKLVKGYQVTKNSVINHEGDLCENVGVIISGKVDIVSYSFQGTEQILNSLKAGDIFGNNLIFSSEPIYRGDVIAKEKCVIAFINKALYPWKGKLIRGIIYTNIITIRIYSS